MFSEYDRLLWNPARIVWRVARDMEGCDNGSPASCEWRTTPEGDLFAPLLLLDRFLVHRPVARLVSDPQPPLPFWEEGEEEMPTLVNFGEPREVRHGRISVRLWKDPLEKRESLAEILLDGERVWAAEGHAFFLQGEGKVGEEGFDRGLARPDINGDGWPEVVIHGWSGGAHAFFTYWIFSLRERPVLLRRLSLGNSGFALEDLDGDGRLEWLAGDDTFAYWNECYAGSPQPRLVFAWNGREYSLASDRFGVREASAKWRERIAASEERSRWLAWHEGGRQGSGPVWTEGFPPSECWEILLDLIYAGEGAQAAEALVAYWPDRIPGREAFRREFSARLRESQFFPEVERMTRPEKRWR